MNRYLDQGVAELVPGVLFIDEVTCLILNVCFRMEPELHYLLCCLRDQ